MTSLENFFSAINQHTGTLPESLGLLPSLQTMDLSRNEFTGRIPSTIGSLSECVMLSFSHNQLSGTVPSQFGSLQKLEQLYLQKNNLRGTVRHLFWQSLNLSLVNLDLSANGFSGDVSPDLFLIPTLETLAMTSNCFTGTLPSEICQADSLSVLSLDGLGVGRHCDVQFSTLYPQWRSTWGTIPECIWGMKNLTVLSLSGNGMEGTISSIPKDTKLINLTLSHNHLTGTIPRSIQIYPFVSLDLSYNKFTGEASSFILPTNMSFRRVLEVNRLSGSLSSISSFDPPPSLKKNAINFLNGNIFGCQSLPEDDVDYQNYLCASAELDNALTIFGGLIGFILVVVLLFLLLKCVMVPTFQSLQSSSFFVFLLETSQSLHKYYHYFDSKELLLEDGFLNTTTGNNKLSQVQAFSDSFRHMKYTVIVVMMVGFVACLPIYVLKGLDSQEYRTHSHLYRWMWTTAFIKGVLPATLLLAAWVLSACVLIVMVEIMATHQSQSHLLMRKSTIDENNYNELERSQKLLTVTAMILANIALVGVVNGLFIYSTLQDLPESLHFWIEISVSIFKIIWNSWILPFLVRTFQKEKSPRLLAMLTLFNTIFIPCIAATFTSTSCFQVPLLLLFLPLISGS
jgi:Leucine-rich repeat (LRR) protein